MKPLEFELPYFSPKYENEFKPIADDIVRDLSDDNYKILVGKVRDIGKKLTKYEVAYLLILLGNGLLAPGTKLHLYEAAKDE